VTDHLDPGGIHRLEEKVRELERANQELTAREARLRAIVEMEPECVKVISPEGTILEMNAAGLRMLEAETLDEVADGSALRFVADPDKEAFSQLIRRALAGEVGVLEFRAVGLRGGRRWLETHATPLRDAAGRVSVVLSVSRDITARRAAEQALRESEQFARGALDGLSAHIAILDERGAIVSVNRSWTDFAMKQAGTLNGLGVGVNYLEVCERAGGGDRELALTFAHGIREVLAERTYEFAIEYPCHGGGEQRWFIARATRFSGAGPRRVVVSHENITERVQLERELLQSQKLESLGRLAGGVAHDFNNLLTVISGYADLVLADLTPGDPLCAGVEEIARAASRASTLTRQLLAFSRRQMMRMTVLNLNTVVADLEGMLRRLIGEDVTLAVSLAPDLGNVYADAGQIVQVIMNLAVNARDAMPRGGRLTIETRNVELDDAYVADHPSATPGPHVLISLSDTGVGMDEATRARAFEPFFTTKGVGVGSGLGLATSYGIVKQSGGSIWVYSEVGIGTTMKVHLPRVNEPVRPLAPATTQRARGHEVVMVVEDEEALRVLTARQLRSIGFTVLSAHSGADALAQLEQYAADVHLLLTDVVMPDMGGRVLASRLAERRPSLKVLYMSGYTEDAVLRHGVLEDGVHFLTKPYTLAELSRKVREALDTPQTG
jgi:two-component system cell cycle sensor histidine kinase/response regulator CckA